jgi:hypothetical protein
MKAHSNGAKNSLITIKVWQDLLLKFEYFPGYINYTNFANMDFIISFFNFSNYGTVPNPCGRDKSKLIFSLSFAHQQVWMPITTTFLVIFNYIFTYSAFAMLNLVSNHVIPICL